MSVVLILAGMAHLVVFPVCTFTLQVCKLCTNMYMNY